MIEFKLPDLGENIEAGTVVSLLVNEGDRISVDQSVLELETDKAVVEIPCPHAGTVTRILVKPGDKVPVGAPVLTLDGQETTAPLPAEAASAEPLVPPPASSPEEPAAPQPVIQEKAPASPPAPAPAVRPTPTAKPRGDRPPPAGPATRRLARQLGVDLHLVKGSGPSGRITAEDVKAYVRDLAQAARAGRGGMAAPPLPDFSQWGPIERRALSGVRKRTAEVVGLAWSLAPHVTQFDVADITDLEAGRKRYVDQHPNQPRVTMTVLAIKAVETALKEFPQFNASLDTVADELILKRYYHIGVAVDTEHGLLVPVLRDVDTKSVLTLAAELEELARRARERKLDLAEMRGGTFTISNLGGIGGTAFTPIVNYPEVAILGIARARTEPVFTDGGIQARLMLPLALSYDHRAIDGADGARFLRKVASMLADPIHLLLEV